MRHMVVIVPELTGYASIRRVAVSLPYAAQLIDGVKYMLPGDVKPPEGGTERRRQRAPRAPSMRTLVRWALKCDSAEQLGERLRRRYQRQQQRQGETPGRQCPCRRRARSILGALTSTAARITLRPHARNHGIQVPSLCCSAHVRHIAVSLPRVDCLVAEQPAKYAVPKSPPGPDTQRARHRGAGRATPVMTIPR